MKNKYWRWYRAPYFLVWAVMALFYGTRIQQTLLYWSLLESWQVYPDRVYLLLTGILLFMIGIGVCALLLLMKGRAVRWVSGLGLLVVIWFWMDQLLFSRIPDRLENLPFMTGGTFFFAIWTILFFHKES